MNRIPFYMRAAQNLAAAGADQKDFPLSKVPSKTTDGLVTHLAKITIVLTGTVAQANGAPAIAPLDWFRLLAIELHRREGDPKFRPNGAAIRAWNAITNRYIERGLGGLPANIAANNSGATVNTAVTVRIPICFDAPGLSDPYAFYWPIASYRGGHITVKTLDPATAFANTITWAGQPQVDLELELDCDHEEHIGQEVELFTKDQLVADTRVDLDAGRYLAICAIPPKFGAASGGDDVSKYSNMSSVDYFAQRLPSQTATQILHQRLSSLESTVAIPTITTAGVVTSGLIIGPTGPLLPLVMWAIGGEPLQSQVISTIDWRADFATSTNIAEKHTFLFVRSFPRRRADEQDVMTYFGHDPKRVSPQARVTPGRPIAASQLAYVGLTIKRQTPATTPTDPKVTAAIAATRIKPDAMVQPRPGRGGGRT